MRSNKQETTEHLVKLSFTAENDVETALLTEIRNRLRSLVHSDDVDVVAIDIGFNTWREGDSVTSLGVTVQIKGSDKKEVEEE